MQEFKPFTFTGCTLPPVFMPPVPVFMPPVPVFAAVARPTRQLRLEDAEDTAQCLGTSECQEWMAKGKCEVVKMKACMTTCGGCVAPAPIASTPRREARRSGGLRVQNNPLTVNQKNAITGYCKKKTRRPFLFKRFF